MEDRAWSVRKKLPRNGVGLDLLVFLQPEENHLSVPLVLSALFLPRNSATGQTADHGPSHPCYVSSDRP